MAHCRVQKPGTGKPFVRPFPTKCISKAFQNGYVDSLIHGLALGKKLVMHQTLRVKESDQHCSDMWPDLPRFLRPRWWRRLPLWLDGVSPNACCSIRMFLWPSFQVSGRTWCKHVIPSTHPFHNTTEGRISIHSRLSQAAIRSSGMWR
jgi:hypothetical protein